MKIRFLSCWILFIFCFTEAASQDLSGKLSSAWQKFESDPQLKYASISLTAINTSTGETLFSKNEDLGLATASTLKTITSATAFHLLGPSFVYQTVLGYTGTIDNQGTLTGDLIIHGGGDPTLGSPRYPQTTEQSVLNEFLSMVRTAGIKQINGRIIGDDRLFGTQTVPGGWIWDDIGNYYGAGPCSLTWRENQFDMIFAAGKKAGDPVKLIRTEPALPFVEVINELTTGPDGSGDNVYAYSGPYTSQIYLRGTYGADLQKVISGSIPDPAYDAVFRLREALSRAGIPSIAAATARRIANTGETLSTDFSVLGYHSSPPLSKIIYWFNQKSINLYGEHLIETMAMKQGKEGTTNNGATAVKEFWNSKLGIDKNAMNVMDGSGLSPATKVTTKAMAQILSSLKKEPWFPDYYESLPTYNDMKMKSGSIKNVLAYAGYETRSGTPVAFSFIINNYNGSQAQVKQKMFNVLNVLK